MEFEDSGAEGFSLAYGAVPISTHETRFCVWAPKTRELELLRIRRTEDQEFVEESISLERDNAGNFLTVVPDFPVGSLYRFKIPGRPGRPDPYSRFQPYGVHGPSQVVDAKQFVWSDDGWRGVNKRDLVVYEMHVGSFSESGTYEGASEQLHQLKSLGINAIELLPLAQTPGQWNWGYDGVNFFAPRNTFGRPDDLKAFINECHQQELAVLLDVVYNHVGPEGNYLNEFGYYRSKKHKTPWGDALNFDGNGCDRVREFVIDNVLFWIDEYHFDGVRLDAIHFMFDESENTIVDEIQRRLRGYSNGLDRKIHLIAESNIYDPHLVGEISNDRPNYDAIWSDCLMHSIYSHGTPEVQLTNRRYTGTADLVQALDHGYIFSVPQAIRVTDVDRQNHHQDGDRQYKQSLIMALQTHDSVGNHPQGKRLHQLTSIEFQLAAAPLILLYPSIPMIFMGEEWASESPFPFFADFEDQRLRDAVDQGRKHEYPQHDWTDSPLPSDPQAFYSSKLGSAKLHQNVFDWYQRVLAFRKTGIDNGWLTIDNKRTEYRLVDHLFQLIYALPEERIVICSRLAMPDDEEIEIELEENAELILDSLQVNQLQAPASRLTLKPRHCCIWRAPNS